MTRVTDLADPRRCKGSAPDGQCKNKALEGGDYCKAHGGRDLTNVRETRSYLLAKADTQARLAQITETLDPVKQLRETIALQGMLIEKRWNLMERAGEAGLLEACGPLNQMFTTMEKLLSSCHKIEQSLGQLLAKQSVMLLAKTIVSIVIDELQGIPGHEAVVDRITRRIIDEIRMANNDGTEEPVVVPEPIDEEDD